MEITPQDHKDFLTEEYYTLREAAELLEVSEDELRSLVTEHKIPAHTIAGVFLRLKKKDIEHLKNKWRIERELFPAPERYFSHRSIVRKATLEERWQDFWYFNDFYILCAALIVALLYFIITSQ